jgi:branched-chain amino acid transport system permease protein
MFADILFNGLLAGGMYAVLAVGFALVFSVARMVNLTHTAFYMLAAFLVYAGVKTFGYGLWLSLIAAIIITSILGIIIFKVFFERVKEHEATVMIISIAVAMLIQELLMKAYGGLNRSTSALIDGYVQIAGTRMASQSLLAVGSSAIILLLLWLWLAKSRIGNAIRAVAQDPEIANLTGMNVNHIYVIVMGVSAAIAGIAGIVMARTISPLMWADPIVIVMASVILGGMGSLGGAVIGALILGYVETLVIFLVPWGSFMGGAVSLMVMVVVLLVKPEGLFGVFFEEERL